ncbi:hypothetical protein J4N45_10330 [Vibrio sp. SCSIO 43140]|uniref:hypothetical protein n=1 Tax=Vibrio sp. SCSIO 43140 TaxID=2819100 RepID=UPI002075FDBC|nr:hypothetical protein [Vibrio sp. SCSIO 43140]USD58926.1 hypothetical protein J4N45_10330 [Vibrio sp. SCSIO 43140]
MADFKQMRRHIPESVLCRSEAMYRYLGTKGGQLIGSTQRVATMYESTENNDGNREVVVSIFEGLFETLEQGQSEFSKQTDAVKREWNRKNRKSGRKLPNVEAPDSHSFTFEITHPIFQRVISVVRKMDNSMAVMETLWMLGELEEQRYKNAKMKLASTLSRFSNDVFGITNKLRSLDPGRGNTQQRINSQINAQLAAVSDEPESVVSDESLADAPINQVSEQSDNTSVLVSSDENPLMAEDIDSVLASQESLKEGA